MRFTKRKIALLTVLTGLVAPSSAMDDFRLPNVRKGIWAVTVDQDIIGQKPKHFGESAGNQCEDPFSSARQNLESLKKNQCRVQVESRSQNEIVFTATCAAPPGTGEHAQIASMRVTIESRSPAEYKVTTTTEHGRVAIAGRWLRDCEPGE
jgi:hypothetical protein